VFHIDESRNAAATLRFRHDVLAQRVFPDPSGP
jgi:hypothetical protein